MTSIHHLDIVVTGAGLTGLSAAMLLARDGHRVTVLDRDAASPPVPPEDAWDHWQRPGVSQFHQPHLMLPRWRHEIERELPEALDALWGAGAARVNLLHLRSEAVTHGWRPGDEQFDTVAARRPVLEAVIGRLAATEPGVSVRRGVRVTGLLTDSADHPTPHVRGLRTSTGDVAADLVVDAAGRRTPLPRWVSGLGSGPDPVETRAPCGFVYYSRYFRAHDGRMPTGAGSVLTHHPSWSVLTLPGDSGTFCVVLVISARDTQLRRLRAPAAWLAAARTSPVAAAWVDHGTPVTAVMPIAGIEDVCRSYVRDGRPVVTGLVTVGDASAATNPSLGRGATIGLLQACALRDTLRETSLDPREQVEHFEASTAGSVTPWVEATTWFDRHRLGELEADIAGEVYRSDDEIWPISTALLTGADHDPVLTRASSTIAGLLAAPPEVLAEPDAQARLTPYLDGPRYPADGPTRADLLDAVTHADLAAS